MMQVKERKTKAGTSAAGSFRTFMSGVMIICMLVLSLGCSNAEERPEETVAYTCTVLNKEVRGASHILEISSPDRHEYVEIEEEHWDHIQLGDSVSFNAENALIRVNNKVIE